MLESELDPGSTLPTDKSFVGVEGESSGGVGFRELWIPGAGNKTGLRNNAIITLRRSETLEMTCFLTWKVRELKVGEEVAFSEGGGGEALGAAFSRCNVVLLLRYLNKQLLLLLYLNNKY